MFCVRALIICVTAHLLVPGSRGVAVAQEASATSSSAEAVATACGDIITYANQDLKNNFLFDAASVYQCLTSVPFLDAVAQRYIDYYNTTIQFQSTLAYLKSPPTGYQQPSVDVQDVLSQIQQNITTGYYANEYDFEATLYSLVQRMHDSHVTLYSGALSAFSFGSPYDIMSISVDGKQIPKVYFKDDVIASQSQGWTPSAVKSINGEDVTQFLQHFASINSMGMLEPNADWNQLMYSPVQDILGTFNLFGWNAVLYPGDNLVFDFENGTITDTFWLAYYLNTDQTGPLTTGGDFYNYFVLGFLPASYVPDALITVDDTNSTGDANDTASTGLNSWYSLSTSYPSNPDVVQPGLSRGGAGGILTGYFLNDISTGVLSIPNFDEWGTDADAFSNTTTEFIQRAKAAGLSKIVIDLQQNYGGDVMLAINTFRQFFPNIEPFAGSRRRSHHLGNILGGAITDFWSDLTPQDTEYDFSDYYVPLAADEWVVTDRLNAATGQNFTSWSQYYGPLAHQGDQFSLTERYNLSSFVFDYSASDGYVPTAVSTSNPSWTSQDIILLTDGICGSTCSVFVEMMTHQAGVRTVVIGGEPSTGPMQAASGGRGARSFTADELDDNMFFASSVNQTANTTLPQVREQAIYTYTMGFNLRDQVRENDDVPLQFKYEAANCRIYYTFANAYNMSRLWRDAASATWSDPSLCVQGSTGYATSGNTTAAKNPPPLGVQAPGFNEVHSGIKAQYPLDSGLGITDGLGKKSSGSFGPCNSNCASGHCAIYDCGNGVQTKVCAPDCYDPGQSCLNGQGTCSDYSRSESKANGPDGSTESESSKGFFVGTCFPNPGQVGTACPANKKNPKPP